MYTSKQGTFPKHRSRCPQGTSLSQLLSMVLVTVALGAPSVWSNSGRADSSTNAHSSVGLPGKRLVCGYDAHGATDELSNHKQHALGLSKLRNRANLTPLIATAGISFEDAGDIALAKDDGTIVITPTSFDLKNRAILFTPDGDGYRISGADLAFTRDYGTRLGFFFGADNRPGNGDDGYRDVLLAGAPFPFYGINYDTIFIGTNGYITFTQGDTSFRLSPTVLASNLPRIAPLWADLEVDNSGNIYYNRLDGHHLITWEGAGQAAYAGLSTFQALLYDDGRIAFSYRKVKAHAALAGISPGGSAAEPQPVDLSSPPAERFSGPVFEAFGKQKRIDLPALLQAFYRTHSDSFDTAYVWTDFDYDNGLGVAHSFNVRNHISGIGLRDFDRGSAYGSSARLSTIITMGNAADWPKNPQAHAVGLNSAISIVCHEQGHRWLAYVRFTADNEIKNDLLGRENAHWSFLVDTRTNSQGTFSSLMEGNAWREGGGGIFTTIEGEVNYFAPLDQYLMGLRSADEVGEIPYLVADAQLTEFLREKSPFSGFSMSAVRKTTSVAQIVSREGPRIPDSANSPRELRVAFLLLTQEGTTPSSNTLEKISRYRDALVRYYSVATGERASMNASLGD
jgi:hypothetical protein